MVEFLQIETVTDLCPKLSHCCSRTQTLFQNPDTVPDSLMPDIGPRCLAYYYFYYSALCRKALLAIVYCTRSNKFFVVVLMQHQLTFPSIVQQFLFLVHVFSGFIFEQNSWVDITLMLLCYCFSILHWLRIFFYQIYLGNF